MKALIARHGKKLFIILAIIPLFLIGFIILDSVRNANKEEALIRLEVLEEEIAVQSQDNNTISSDEIKERIVSIQNNTNNKYVIQKSNFILATWLASQQNWEEAEKIFGVIYEESPRGHLKEVSIYNAAIAAEEQDNNDKAIEYLEQFLSDYSDRGSALMSKTLFTLGRLYEKISNTADALQYYQQVVNEHSGSEWVNLSRNRIVQLKIK